jgi:putative phosphoesterase
MRLAVLADVHGNLPALEAVLEDFKQYSLDGVIVAGDFVGGPHPNETLALLCSIMPHWMIIGNSDIGLLRYHEGQAPEYQQTAKQFALLRWACQRIDLDSLEILRNLPEQRVILLDNSDPVRIVHGRLETAFDGYDPEEELDNLESDLAEIKERVLICGHTHCPWVFQKNGKLALNPGSVAGPLNGYIGTQYALLEWLDGRWQAELHAIKYDLTRIRSDFVQSGLLETGGPLAHCFLNSIETGRDGSLRFLEHAWELVKQAGLQNISYIPDEIWDLAEASYDWTLFQPK